MCGLSFFALARVDLAGVFAVVFAVVVLCDGLRGCAVVFAVLWRGGLRAAQRGGLGRQTLKGTERRVRLLYCEKWTDHVGVTTS